MTSPFALFRSNLMLLCSKISLSTSGVISFNTIFASVRADLALLLSGLIDFDKPDM